MSKSCLYTKDKNIALIEPSRTSNTSNISKLNKAKVKTAPLMKAENVRLPFNSTKREIFTKKLYICHLSFTS